MRGKRKERRREQREKGIVVDKTEKKVRKKSNLESGEWERGGNVWMSVNKSTSKL